MPAYSDLFLILHVTALTVTGICEVCSWFRIGRGTVAGPEELRWATEEIP